MIELFEPGEMVWIDDTIANIVEDLGGDALDVIINGKPMLVTRREIERIQPDPEEQPYDGPPDGFGYPSWR